MRLSVLVGIILACAPLLAGANITTETSSLPVDAIWGPDTRLTNNTYPDYTYWTSQRRVVQGPNGMVHVAWHVQNSGLGTYNMQVYYKRYIPGTGWTADTMISADLYSAGTYNKYASLAVDSTGRVFLVWGSGPNSSAEANIYCKTCVPTGSGNGGWDTASTLISSGTGVVACPSVAATPDNHVHVVWKQGQAINYREWNGSAWLTQQSIVTSFSYTAYPSVAGSRDNNVHVAFYGYPSSGYYKIYYIARISGVWGSIENPSGTGGRHQMYQCIACDPATNQPHIIWQGDAAISGLNYVYRIVHAWKTTSWSADTVSDTAFYGAPAETQIAFSLNGTGHAVWKVYVPRSPTESMPQIRYRERTPAGTWNEPVSLTDTSGTKERPSVAASSTGEVHVVWSDYRDGNSEIYYKRGVMMKQADVGCSWIGAPVGAVDSGTSVVPACSVYNYGDTTAASYLVRMKVGSGYNETATVNNHAQGTSVYVTFPNWTATGRGWFAVSCSTELEDPRPSNNRRRDSVMVAVHDVGARMIVAPTGTITPGPVTPACTMTNYGNTVEPTRAYFGVWQGPTRVWLDSVNLAGWNGDTLVRFNSYNAGAGVFQTAFWTALGSDQVRANDTVRGSFVSGTFDVEARSINAPTGNVDTGATVTPAATVRNNGSFAATFGAWFFIDSAGTRIYSSSRTVTDLAPGASTPVTFDQKPKPHFEGTYATRCSVYLSGDGNPANDVISGTFRFVATPPVQPGWHEKSSMPLLPSGKAAKDGAWLADDGDYIYAAKGNKTPDFYRYVVAGDTWQTLARIPLGREGKVPGKGAVGVVGRYVYAVKGNNTQGFWRYDPGQDSWFQMADIPLGTTNKKVKGGSDIVFVNNQGQEPDYLYLLKGGRNEFWRYDISGDSWSAMPDAPAGISGKAKYDKGSWLVERRLPRQGPRVIYCHKAKYHELFVFDTEADTWLSGQLAGMPFLGSTGKSKKSKDGGCAASLGDYIYALKGGNTQEFWQYDVDLDSWHEAEPLPLLGSSGKNKKVKAGADMVSTRDCLYALKGNKTLEFWQYVPLAGARGLLTVGGSGVSTSSLAVGHLRLSILPNPLRAGFVTTRLDGQAARWSSGPVKVSVLDVSGRCVRHLSFVIGNSSLLLDLRGLSAGVYTLQLSAGGRTATQKLVIH